MLIQPLGNLVQLDIKEATAGVLDTSSRDTAVEVATVVNVGYLVKANAAYPQVGDKVFVKAWAVDIINHEDKKYYFVDITSNGILAVIKD